MSASAARLVQDLVRAGGEVPDAAALGAVKRYARQSDAHVAEVFEAVWEQLGDKHSQARYLALQLCAELWPRSAAFRCARVARIAPDFVRLVTGELAGGAELPPPQQWAERRGAAASSSSAAGTARTASSTATGRLRSRCATCGRRRPRPAPVEAARRSPTRAPRRCRRSGGSAGA